MPSVIYNLKYLYELYITGSDIETISPDIVRMKTIKLLLFTEDNLDSIPAQIFEIPTLKRLILYNNKIKEFPKIINLKCALEELNVTGNPLSDSEKARIKSIFKGTNILIDP